MHSWLAPTFNPILDAASFFIDASHINLSDADTCLMRIQQLLQRLGQAIHRLAVYILGALQVV